MATEEISRAVVLLARRLRQERQSSLTPNQLAVLGALRLNGPQTPSALAAIEKVQPPSMTRVLKNLEAERLIERTDDSDDGRQSIVVISTKGLEVLKTERRQRDAWLAAHLKNLSADERDALETAAEIMERIARS